LFPAYGPWKNKFNMGIKIVGSIVEFRNYYENLGCCFSRKLGLFIKKKNQKLINKYLLEKHNFCGPGSSVGVASDYGLDGPGYNPGGGRDFLQVQTGPGVHPGYSTMGTESFPGVEASEPCD